MKRTFTLLLAVIMTAAMLLSMAACGAENQSADDNEVISSSNVQPSQPVRIAALNGPTGISVAKLATDAAESGEYDVTFVGAPDEITGLLTTGEVDAAFVPTNLASVLYNKTGGSIRTAAVTTLGVLYLLDTSGEVNSLADIDGKTVGATGQGSNPEYILNYIIEGNGLENVTTQYYTEHSELAALMISGDVKTAMLPVPFATQVATKLEGVNSIDLQAEWAKISDTPIAQGVLVCTADFADNNKADLDKLLADFEVSANFANENPAETAQYVEKLGIISSAALTEKAIPQCNIVCITGEEMKSTVSDFLEVLYAANPKSVGGAMPNDDFYVVG